MDLRRRITFKFSEETEEGPILLDDQEQEEVIETLRKENAKSNKQSISMMKIVLLLSTILHIIYFINPTDDPLLILLPRANLVDSTSVRNFLVQAGVGLDGNIQLGNYTLSPTLAYALAFVAPAVCLFLKRSWLTVAWWSITVCVTYAVQLVLEAAAQGDEHIRSLEAMKYAAPGA
ncbi:hypothetical protein DFH05DRAFT_783915 [Lentinula detonsa]|uniref:Uncharacterized protein n=1 Tax=Lentinula detonsa TaxID=2804962 RepID=A0A9W8P5A2_9AGAR|nr:hypothetical protein DFH05DRAFT_783915 [Lentinula detonsa]